MEQNKSVVLHGADDMRLVSHFTQCYILSGWLKKELTYRNLFQSLKWHEITGFSICLTKSSLFCVRLFIFSPLFKFRVLQQRLSQPQTRPRMHLVSLKRTRIDWYHIEVVSARNDKVLSRNNYHLLVASLWTRHCEETVSKLIAKTMQYSSSYKISNPHL